MSLEQTYVYEHGYLVAGRSNFANKSNMQPSPFNLRSDAVAIPKRPDDRSLFPHSCYSHSEATVTVSDADAFEFPHISESLSNHTVCLSPSP